MFEVSGDGFGYWVQRVGLVLTRTKMIPRFADAYALATTLNAEEGGDAIDGPTTTRTPVVVTGAHRAVITSATTLNATTTEGGENIMSVKTTLEELFGTLLIVGQQLTPIFVHNPTSKGAQVTTVLTTDVDALFAELTGLNLMAPQTTTPAKA